MTLHTPGPEAPPKDFTSHATLLYELAADVFKLVLEEAADGDPKAAGQAVSYAKELRAALSQVLLERNNVEKLRRDSEGFVRDCDLDFDEARIEIGRRLALLRDAGAD